ncbi:MAG: beta-propeller domain-containing protein [Coriobacteriales bacterium]|jgi:uncharacterized secreted protein with C-terminal beta-propeller domain|nr:beta-propeller domain-containing protein [Coriobacteriales bacterium]
MTKNILNNMKEQMTPSDELLDRLTTALEAEDAQPSGSDSAETAGSVVASGSAAVSGTSGLPSPVPSARIDVPGSVRPLRQKKRRYVWGIAAAAAVMVLVVVGVTAALGSQFLDDLIDTALGGRSGNTTIDLSPTYEGPSGNKMTIKPVSAESYAEIYQTIDGFSYTSSYGGDIAYDTVEPLGTEDSVAGAEVMQSAPASGSESAKELGSSSVAPEISADSGSSVASSDYSTTNTQVEGIDEGDIVKTDGDYIYAVSRGDLVIFTATGADTTEVFRASVADLDNLQTVYELYISDSTLAVIVQSYAWYEDGKRAGGNSYYYQGDSLTKVLLFNVKDPANAILVGEYAGSGYYNTSRLNDGVLYFVTNYSLQSDVVEDDPATYVPLRGVNGVYECLPVEDICILPQVNSPTYTVINSIDLGSRQFIDSSSALGGTETVYMSDDNLYLGSSVYEDVALEPYRESVYTVTEYRSGSNTHIIRVSADKGNLDITAETSIPGTLLNQFSLDEYQGNLRVATTDQSYGYKVYLDEELDIESYKYDDNQPSSALFVLDPDLEVVGSITGLAEDERIYSVRFTGKVGYVVTYRQMDPLFAVDLSNPRVPKIMSELKIPGFSTYLHPFSEGRLFGIGHAAVGSSTGNVKLSMFDTSNPYDVTELSTKELDIYYTSALDDHKTVLIDAEHDLIAFPGEDSYLVYGYTDKKGFYLKAELPLDDDDAWGGRNTRGFYVDNYLYVYSMTRLNVYDLNTFAKVKTLKVNDAPERSDGKQYIE